jgi:outer membrane protein assembly factor BamE (lipoprotein component of BamABCDE complex)
MKAKLILLIIAAVLLAGCASVSTTRGTAKLSREFVEKNLIRGKTTKDQVRALLGEPKSTASSDMGIPGMPAETWTYIKTFYRDAAEKSGLGGSFARYAVTGSLYDRVEVSVLMVMFDKSGRVSGHTFSTSSAGASR